jgi:hypothetical protein
MRNEQGWHRADHAKHANLELWRTWRHSNGCEIWQGRPYEDKRQFEYRMVRPDGSTVCSSLLALAKRAALEPPPATDAVDPQVDNTGKPTTRV